MATPPPPPAAPVPPPPPSAPVPPAAAKGNRTLMIVLIILGVILLLIGGCAVACGILVKKAADKTKTYAAESEKNPQLAAISLIASVHPDIEVVSKDFDAGVITLRNKKTGETVKLDVNNYTNEAAGKALEQFSKGIKPTNAEPAQVETSAAAARTEEPSAPEPTERKVSSAQAAALKSALKKFPADFPIYNSGGATTLEAEHNSIGTASSYEHTFSTSDSPEDVVDFYAKKMIASGYTQIVNNNGSNDNGPTATAAFQKGEGASTLTINAEIENGKTQVKVGVLAVQKQ